MFLNELMVLLVLLESSALKYSPTFISLYVLRLVYFVFGLDTLQRCGKTNQQHCVNLDALFLIVVCAFETLP